MIRKQSILWTVCVFLLLAAVVTSTFAWLGLDQNTIVTSISGSLVTEYFHCGSGTKNDPFVITRPIHYYHMVEFFQRLTNLPTVVDSNKVIVKFGEQYLYFQIGCSEERLYDPTLTTSSAADTDCVVFDYSSTGELLTTSNSKGDSSTTLNMAYYSGDLALMPIGTSEIPFYGSLDGKGITVANLNVATTTTVNVNTYDSSGNVTATASVTRKTSDVGIFGYVTGDSTIQNVYFSNATISLEGANASADDSVTTATNHETEHTDTVYVGYLCGHIHTYTENDAEPFTTPFYNVYLNGCTITGGSVTGTSVVNNYGYYGCVDSEDGSVGTTISALETESGAGNDYSFIFNAADAYNFLGTLDTSKTLITRDWGESGQGSTLSSAITNSSTYYQLVGHSPDTSSVSYDYSFNTIGYSGETNYYDLYYKNGQYITLSSDVTLTSTAPTSTLTETGSYIYNAGSNYKYYAVTQGYESNYVGTNYAVYYLDGSTYKTLSIPSTTSVTTVAPTAQTTLGSFFYYENGQWYYYNVTTVYSDGAYDAYYPLYYKNGDTYTMITSGTTLSEPSATCDTVGAGYLYYSDGQWNYSVCTSASEVAQTFDVTFQGGSTTFTVTTTVNNVYSLSSTTLNSSKKTGTLYVDGESKGTVEVTLSVAGTVGNRQLTGTITATVGDVTVSELTAGTHKYAILVDVSGITCTFNYKERSNSKNTKSITATTSGRIYCGTLSGTTLTQSTSGTLSSSSNTVSMTYTYTTSSVTYNDSTKGSFATSTDAVFTTYPVYSNSGVYYCSAGNANTESSWSQYTTNETPTEQNGYLCREATITTTPTASVYKQYSLSYGDSHIGITDADVFTNASPDDRMTYLSGAWKYVVYHTEITDAVISGPYDVYYNNGTDYTLLTTAPVTYGGSYKYSESGDVYIADAYSSYVSYTDSNGNVWRYNSDNMDIVGGLQFYSTYVYMNGYAKNTTTLTSSSLGTKFYGHSMCPDSILLYIKNIQDLDDSASMGTITAYYDKSDGNNTAADSMRLNRYQMSDDSDTDASRGFSTSLGCSETTKTINGTSRTGYSAELKRSMIEQVAYCGIDADGDIVCYPSTDDLKMIYADGKTEADVAYYVLFLGVSSGHLQVYEIDFEFKAESGVGTTDVLKPVVSEESAFKYVDYRNASGTVTTSLINMSWTMPSGATSSNFSVSVSYGSTATIGLVSYYCYVITIVNSTGNSMDLSVLLFDDDSDADTTYPYVYQIVYNGNIVTNTSYTTDGSEQNYWQASDTHTLS